MAIYKFVSTDFNFSKFCGKQVGDEFRIYSKPTLLEVNFQNSYKLLSFDDTTCKWQYRYTNSSGTITNTGYYACTPCTTTTTTTTTTTSTTTTTTTPAPSTTTTEAPTTSTTTTEAPTTSSPTPAGPPESQNTYTDQQTVKALSQFSEDIMNLSRSPEVVEEIVLKLENTAERIYLVSPSIKKPEIELHHTRKIKDMMQKNNLRMDDITNDYSSL